MVKQQWNDSGAIKPCFPVSIGGGWSGVGGADRWSPEVGIRRVRPGWRHPSPGGGLGGAALGTTGSSCALPSRRRRPSADSG